MKLEEEIDILRLNEKQQKKIEHYNKDLAANAMKMKIEKEMLVHELEDLKTMKLDYITFILIAAEIERLNNVNKKLIEDTNLWKTRYYNA